MTYDEILAVIAPGPNQNEGWLGIALLALGLILVIVPLLRAKRNRRK